MAPLNHSTADVDVDLTVAEQTGLKLMLKTRTVILVVLIVVAGASTRYPTNVFAILVVGFFIAAGIIQHSLVGSQHDRWWHRYAFFSLDVAAIGVMLTFAPLSLGTSDVPQIFIFRTWGVGFVFPMIVLSALSLSPGLVLWAGTTLVISRWAAFLWIVSGMERTLDWSDLPVGPSREQFLDVFLDPDFIGTGSRFSETFYILACTAALALVVHRARQLVRARATADRERARAQEVFGQYVPPQIAQRLLETETSLLPENRTASVLFADIEGFTRLSEKKTPEEVIALLNSFFDAATEIVSENGGVVISFVGDAVVAAFNAPLPTEDHAQQAVRTARALLHACAEREFEGQRLKLRVGVATGPVAAGSVGGGQRQAYTVYGDTVNLAQRLEVLNKELGTRALFLEATAAAAGPEVEFRKVASTPVRGRNEPVDVFTFADNVA